MIRHDVIDCLTKYFYDVNCTDRSLVHEWISNGHKFPGYNNMTNDQLIDEWELMFDETITII